MVSDRHAASGNPYAVTAPLTIGLLLTASAADAVFPSGWASRPEPVQKGHSPKRDRLAAPRAAAVTKNSSTGSGTMYKTGFMGSTSDLSGPTCRQHGRLQHIGFRANPMFLRHLHRRKPVYCSKAEDGTTVGEADRRIAFDWWRWQMCEDEVGLKETQRDAVREADVGAAPN